ncbi:MAG: hypothetical protein ABIO79_01675 [Ferruginibacter sp.]
MKKMTRVLAFLAISLLALQVDAQKVKTISGNDDVLKPESSINIEFVYDGLSVGNYSNEADYVKAKTEEYNKKEPGKGDTWAASWAKDKAARFEPKFIELFKINSGMSVVNDAKYTLIFKTISIEPGFNIAIKRKNAEIDGEVWIVETANRSNKVAVFTISNVPGGTPFGYDFDTGLRISEAYANAGKKLAKSLK